MYIYKQYVSFISFIFRGKRKIQLLEVYKDFHFIPVPDSSQKMLNKLHSELQFSSSGKLQYYFNSLLYTLLFAEANTAYQETIRKMPQFSLSSVQPFHFISFLFCAATVFLLYPKCWRSWKMTRALEIQINMSDGLGCVHFHEEGKYTYSSSIPFSP